MKTYTVNVYEENNPYPYPAGTVAWRNKKGWLHCEHGPALIFPDKTTQYWLHGAVVTKEKWKELVVESKQHTIKIDDKKIVVSHESYENLKKELV